MTDAPPPTVLTPDLCVIGAGSAGLSLAAAAAAFGTSVVLVERGKMGGDCLNTGCIPSKALIAAARTAAAIRAAPEFGLSTGAVTVDFAAVMAHVHGVIDAIAPVDSAERFTGLGVKVIAAEARFLDRDTLLAGPHRIKARRFAIATGSRPRIPPVEGLGAVPFLTNETLFDLESLPAHLVILGGGPIGMEMGQAFRRLGSAVTIIEAHTVLAADDPDLVAILRREMLREGVAIRESARATGIAGTEGAIAVTIETPGGTETINGTHLLVATGRTADVGSLDLAAAGIASGPDGITVDAGLRTANRRIYAIGDAIGGPQFTHRANHQAGIVARAILFRLPGREARDRLPHVTFTEPGLGQVGLTEAEARRRGLRYRVLTVPFSENDRAQADRNATGLLKLVVGRGGRLLGGGVVGPEAGELINLLSLALSRKLGMRQLQDFISPYPSYGEIGKRAATAYFAPYARRGTIRKLVRFLARWD